MKKEPITAEDLINEIKIFRQQQQCLLLATCSANNEPLASYAPFVEDDDGHLYVLLSDIAKHSVNLKQHKQAQTKLSVLLIEDQLNARNIFARKRLSYDCTVSICSREQAHWQFIIERLKDKFGKTIEVLTNLNDFKLYCLTLLEGNYVRGFGQAYKLKEAKFPIILEPISNDYQNDSTAF